MLPLKTLRFLKSVPPYLFAVFRVFENYFLPYHFPLRKRKKKHFFVAQCIVYFAKRQNSVECSFLYLLSSLISCENLLVVQPTHPLFLFGSAFRCCWSLLSSVAQLSDRVRPKVILVQLRVVQHQMEGKLSSRYPMSSEGSMFALHAIFLLSPTPMF